MKTLAKVIEENGSSFDRVSVKSQIPLSRLIDISAGQPATLAELRKIANALKLELSYFLENNESENQTKILFRQTMGTKLKQSHLPVVDVLSRKVEQSLLILSETQSHVWLNEFDIAGQTYSEAQRQAEKFRDLFFGDDQFSPILQLPELVVEELGVILSITPHLKIDGASAIVNGVAFIFVAPRLFIPRMLFTLAHELGHLIAHHKIHGNFATFDTEESTGNVRPTTRYEDEWFADAFASCLLLPANGVGITLRKIRQVYGISGNEFGDIELLYLAQIYGVSFQTAAKRCEDLGIIERGSAISLYEKLRTEHGSPEKRAKELGLPERPEIRFPSVPLRLLESAISKVRSGEISAGKAATSLNVSIPYLIEANSNLFGSNSETVI